MVADLVCGATTTTRTRETWNEATGDRVDKEERAAERGEEVATSRKTNSK
jgi:hypothetical protein